VAWRLLGAGGVCGGRRAKSRVRPIVVSVAPKCHGHNDPGSRKDQPGRHRKPSVGSVPSGQRRDPRPALPPRLCTTSDRVRAIHRLAHRVRPATARTVTANRTACPSGHSRTVQALALAWPHLVAVLVHRGAPDRDTRRRTRPRARCGPIVALSAWAPRSWAAAVPRMAVIINNRRRLSCGYGPGVFHPSRL
jgi:hypothetical protein